MVCARKNYSCAQTKKELIYKKKNLIYNTIGTKNNQSHMVLDIILYKHGWNKLQKPFGALLDLKTTPTCVTWEKKPLIFPKKANKLNYKKN